MMVFFTIEWLKKSHKINSSDLSVQAKQESNLTMYESNEINKYDRPAKIDYCLHLIGPPTFPQR